MKGQRKNQSSRSAIAAGVPITLYFATYVITGVICMPVAVLFLIIPEAVAFFAAPTYHMMLTKSPDGAPIFITAILPSIVLIASGYIPIVPLVAVPSGILALLIARHGGYRNFKWNTISHILFSWNLFGRSVPIWFMRDHFFQTTLGGGMSQIFCDTARALTPWWMLPVVTIVTVVCSLLGSMFTRKVLYERLEKAGVV